MPRPSLSASSRKAASAASSCGRSASSSSARSFSGIGRAEEKSTASSGGTNLRNASSVTVVVPDPLRLDLDLGPRDVDLVERGRLEDPQRSEPGELQHCEEGRDRL